MIELSKILLEKLKINKDTSLDNTKDILYSIIKDVLEKDFDYSRYQYIISHDSDNKQSWFIIRKNPEVKRRLAREQIYNTIKDKVKSKDISISSNIDTNRDFSEKLCIYY